MSRDIFRRCVSIATSAVMTASIGLTFTSPARATDDFADSARSKIQYTRPLLTSSVNCASLVGRKLDAEATITSATLVAATAGMPAYCDVDGIIGPSQLFDVALPVAWNKRLYGLGNGGCGGVLAGSFPQRNVGLANNFAVASTDTDIENVMGNCAWAANKPELVVDFSYAGIHKTALVAKQIIQMYYEQAPLKSYYNSCSDGGHDGLEEAQKFPNDYDGIVAGSTLLGAGTVMENAWSVKAYAELPTSEAMTPAKADYIASVVYAKCDALDGLADGIINDPQECARIFHPRRDLAVCRGGTNGPTCLTRDQLNAYIHGLSPVMSNGRAIYPGLALGTEPAYVGTQFAAPGAPPTATLDYFLSNSYMQYLFPWPRTEPNKFSDLTFDFDRDPYRIYPFRIMFDPTNLDMYPFFSRGGRLMTYHGLADPLITPYGSVAFYEDELHLFGPQVSSVFKFYTVPGMGHCSGGVGADQFDPMTKMINWVEGHTEPDTILSRHIVNGAITFTRTLCPYPFVAHYRGVGNPAIARSFDCVQGRRGVPETGPDNGLQLP